MRLCYEGRLFLFGLNVRKARTKPAALIIKVIISDNDIRPLLVKQDERITPEVGKS